MNEDRVLETIVWEVSSYHREIVQLGEAAVCNACKDLIPEGCIAYRRTPKYAPTDAFFACGPCLTAHWPKTDIYETYSFFICPPDSPCQVWHITKSVIDPLEE